MLTEWQITTGGVFGNKKIRTKGKKELIEQERTDSL